MAQGLDIELFAAQTLGGTYGNPEPTLLRNRGTYQGQCVSYERQRLSAMDGVNWGAVGDAVSYANSANKARYKSIGYAWKPGDTSFKDGDVLVWGDDAGSWTGKEGHISTWYNGKLLNQNFGGSLKVTQNNFFPAGYLGRYTKQQGEEMAKPNQQQVNDSFVRFTGNAPSNQAQIDYYLNRDISVLYLDLLGTIVPGADKTKQLFNKYLKSDPTATQSAYYSARPISYLYGDIADNLKLLVDKGGNPGDTAKLQAIKDALK